MANYNGVTYLPQAIASIQHQTLNAWELIAVDDASTDASLAILQEAAARDPRIRVFAQPRNAGPGAARNRALSEVRGQWVAIFDSDDVMRPERLERLVAGAREDDALIVADNQQICDQDLAPRELYLSTDILGSRTWIDLAAFVASSHIHSRVPDLGFLKPLIASSAITRVGARYDEGLRIGEDFHFLLQLLAAGTQIRVEPEALYLYRKHDTSISHRQSRDTLLAILAADRAFLKKGHALDAKAVSAFRGREASVRSWLAYDQMLEAVRGRRFVKAVGTVLSRPHAWKLMSAPVASRLRRLTEAPSRVPLARERER